mgnify:CR=1 FL=1|tara:strand:- start:1497 stop:1802 length:306 start_codon:yes stop_codon:yes gene_type:complete
MNNQKIATELLDMAESLVASDLPNDKELRKFYNYVMSFYGQSELYPITKNGRFLPVKDLEKATWKLLKSRHEWGDGDSVDREAVRDILFDGGYEYESENSK